MSFDQVNNMFGIQHGFVEQVPRMQKVIGTLLVLGTVVPIFVMLYILRSIYRYVKGTKVRV
jgi:hypothetical protein